MQVRCVKVLPFLPKTTKSPPNWYFKGDFRELHWLCISREPLPGNPVECTPLWSWSRGYIPQIPARCFSGSKTGNVEKLSTSWCVLISICIWATEKLRPCTYIYIKYPKSEWMSSFWSEVCNKISSKRVPYSRKTRAAEIFFAGDMGVLGLVHKHVTHRRRLVQISRRVGSKRKLSHDIAPGDTWGMFFFPETHCHLNHFESLVESLVLSCLVLSFLFLF